jgi:hypothetical protein
LWPVVHEKPGIRSGFGKFRKETELNVRYFLILLNRYVTQRSFERSDLDHRRNEPGGRKQGGVRLTYLVQSTPQRGNSMR